MKTSISLNFKDVYNKKGQRTITDINPSATSSQIKTFAQGLNALTTNTYEYTNRIQVIEVDTEEIPGVSNNG